MSVFRKLASLLFEEADEEVIAEDELEPVELKEKPKKEAKQPDIREYEPYREPVRETASVRQDPKEEEKKFVSIDLEEKPKVQPVVQKAEKAENTRPTHVKTLRKEERKEFEFSPVISPIFGAKDEPVKQKKKPVTVPKTNQRKKKNNPLGTIISPYYGVGELEEFEQQAQEKMEEKEKIKKQELPVEELERHDLEEEINSVPLEELLDETSEEEHDDLMQISLFGESTPIRDADDTAKE